MNLTEHFTLEEFIVSNTGERLGIDNTPSAAILANIQRTAELLERARALLGGSVIILTSGYRSPALNAAVGGAANSAHIHGLAADIIAPGYGSPRDVSHVLWHGMDDLDFDQLIFEFDSWTHIGLRDDTPRRQVLTIDAGGTRTGLLT